MTIETVGIIFGVIIGLIVVMMIQIHEFLQSAKYKPHWLLTGYRITCGVMLGYLLYLIDSMFLHIIF